MCIWNWEGKKKRGQVSQSPFSWCQEAYRIIITPSLLNSTMSKIVMLVPWKMTTDRLASVLSDTGDSVTLGTVEDIWTKMNSWPSEETLCSRPAATATGKSELHIATASSFPTQEIHALRDAP